jgi:hypothetical protein
MQTSTRFLGFEATELTAINIAKVTTILCLVVLVLIYGIYDWPKGAVNDC